MTIIYYDNIYVGPITGSANLDDTAKTSGQNAKEDSLLCRLTMQGGNSPKNKSKIKNGHETDVSDKTSVTLGCRLGMAVAGLEAPSA